MEAFVVCPPGPSTSLGRASKELQHASFISLRNQRIWCMNSASEPNSPTPSLKKSKAPATPNASVPAVETTLSTLSSSSRKQTMFRIAIIGGGIAGLFCAKRLQELSDANAEMIVDVFDTGKKAVGGRASSRIVPIQTKSKDPAAFDLVFDHAAQFFTVSDPRFQKHVDELEAAGVVKKWTNPIYSFDKKGSASPSILDESITGVKYIGTPYMGAISNYLSSPLNIRRPEWVSVLKQSDEENPNPLFPGARWKLYANRNKAAQDDALGTYDVVVLSHNGKCADRLITTAQIPRVARFMRTLFTSQYKENVTNKMQMSSIWSVMVAFEKPLDSVPFEGAFFPESKVLSWAGNNTKKLGNESTWEAWTLLSTKEFGSLNKVPQESLPEETEKAIVDALLREFEAQTGLPSDSIKPHFQKAQLWGAAVPINALYNTRIVWDPSCKIGICGDWLKTKSNIESAALSGLELADAIHNHYSNGIEMSIGMNEKFGLPKPSGMDADIGSFGAAKPKVVAKPQSKV